jgi:hypothetical protein
VVDIAISTLRCGPRVLTMRQLFLVSHAQPGAHVDVLRRRLMASPHPPSDGGADSQHEGDGSAGGHPVIDRCNKLGTMSHRAFSLAFRLVFLAMPLAAGALNPVWGMAACVGVVGMLAVVDGAVEV